MPRVRLPVLQLGTGLEFADPSTPGATGRVPSLRVMATILIGPDPTPPAPDNRLSATAVLDTGAPYSVIDRGTWEAYERQGLVELLPAIGTLPPLKIGGNTTNNYQLGRIWIGVVGPRGSGPRVTLPAVPVVFQILPANTKVQHPIILGLRSGVLDDRILTRTVVPATTGPVNRNDAGPTYGQDWFLETP